MKTTFLLQSIVIALMLISCGSSVEKSSDQQDWKSWAPTPPMGWNSYDAYHGAITEEQFLKCVDVLSEEFLSYGWEYAVVDFCWYRPATDSAWYTNDWEPFILDQERDNEGNFIPGLVMDEFARVLPDPLRWPSAKDGSGFKEVGDYVHSKGMKFGIHIMRGVPREAVEAKMPIKGTNYTVDQIVNVNDTCPWMNHMYGIDIRKPGAQEYYNSIFELYASWGVDFIKADDMMVPPYHKGEIEMMHNAILATGRPIVLSLSCGEAPVSQAEHLEMNANLYRISADFWDRWHDVERMFELTEMWSPFIGNGTWPDADMLPVGRLCLNDYPSKDGTPRTHKVEHDSNFSEEEHFTLMSLWSIARSPLMWGGDPLTSSDWSKNFLKNEEVLKVNQESENNRQIYERGDSRIWIADIPGSEDKYLGLFNIADYTQNVTFNYFWELLPSEMQVRDLWSKKDLGIFKDAFSAELRPHEGRLYRLSTVK